MGLLGLSGAILGVSWACPILVVQLPAGRQQGSEGGGERQAAAHTTAGCTAAVVAGPTWAVDVINVAGQVGGGSDGDGTTGVRDVSAHRPAGAGMRRRWRLWPAATGRRYTRAWRCVFLVANWGCPTESAGLRYCCYCGRTSHTHRRGSVARPQDMAFPSVREAAA